LTWEISDSVYLQRISHSYFYALAAALVTP
jgi:hypothetical protein